MPEYVSVRGVDVAWDRYGDAGPDVLFIPSFVSHLDLAQGNPTAGRFIDRLSEFCRIVVYDKGGTGLSGPVAHAPTLEERVAEAKAVMDAAGLDQAVVMGLSEGGPSAIMLAATDPARVSQLVLFGTFALGALAGEPEAVRLTRQHLASWNELVGDVERYRMADSQFDIQLAIEEAIYERWGTGDALGILVPTAAEAPAVRTQIARFERCAASPQMARATWASAGRLNVLPLLESITVPTLVVHFTDDPIPVQQGRLIADRIPTASLLELPGIDHAPWLAENPSAVLREVEGFLTGGHRPAVHDRRVMTVLFEDIVGSTEAAARLGDEAWREVLEAHNRLVLETLASAGGDRVKNLGDGFVAAFEGPSQAVRCGLELVARLAGMDIGVRIGVHTGEVELLDDDIGGIGVHIAARVGVVAGEGQVLVSRTVRDLLIGSALRLGSVGVHELKGVPDGWELFAAEDADRAEVLEVRDEKPLTAGDRAAARLSRISPRTARALLSLTPEVREMTRRIG